MRKFSSMLMAALICVLVFCGCEKSDTNGAQSGAQTSTEESSEESSAQSESAQEESSAEESQQIDNPPDDSEIGSIL